MEVGSCYLHHASESHLDRPLGHVTGLVQPASNVHYSCAGSAGFSRVHLVHICLINQLLNMRDCVML